MTKLHRILSGGILLTSLLASPLSPAIADGVPPAGGEPAGGGYLGTITLEQWIAGDYWMHVTRSTQHFLEGGLTADDTGGTVVGRIFGQYGGTLYVTVPLHCSGQGNCCAELRQAARDAVEAANISYGIDINAQCVYAGESEDDDMPGPASGGMGGMDDGGLLP